MFALTALFLGKGAKRLSGRTVNWLVFLGIFGAALFYGDGIITPVISVLSAVEGLNVATKTAEPFVLPITCGILAGLFLFQYLGTERIGKVFGPIMMLWFVAIAALGLAQLLRRPEILAALDPRYAGVYQNPAYVQLTIAVADKALTATCGPKEVKATLAPWDRDTFKFSWPDASDTDELTLAVFTIGPEGKAQSLSLNWDEGAKFKRLEANRLLKCRGCGLPRRLR